MAKAPARRNQRNGTLRVLSKVGNPFVGFLLQSPLHGLLGAKFMLITVTGRKTGRTYTTPVNYVREGDTLTVISRKNRTWWRNLSEAAPVFVRIKGKRRTGMGRVLPLEGAALVAAVSNFYGGMGLRPDPAKIEATAAESVVVRIELE